MTSNFAVRRKSKLIHGTLLQFYCIFQTISRKFALSHKRFTNICCKCFQTPPSAAKKGRGPDKKPRKSGPDHKNDKHGKGKNREYNAK